MAAISPNPNKVEHLIDAYWESHREAPRPHLGASQLGNPCERALWYAFRWALEPEHSGRILRLFARGHREEDVMIGYLRQIGVNVSERDEQGKQFGFAKHGGHFSGSVDGIGTNIPEAPVAAHLLELKTSNDKHFAALKKEGVEKNKPVHFVQMQVYMLMMDLDRALYMVVNKNTDELWTERVRLDHKRAQGYLVKAERVINAKTPPPRHYADPAHYLCKLCDFWDVCHGDRVARVNCRTCIESTPEMDGNQRWSCALWKVDPNKEQQQAGCQDHRFIPDLIPHSECLGSDGREVRYRVIATDQEFINGAPGEGSYSSDELANLDPRLINDPGIAAMREHFDARVVELSDQQVTYEAANDA